MNNNSCLPGVLAKTTALLALVFVCTTANAIDPTLTVGADECVDCHTAEHEVWGETTHFKTYDELSSSDSANEIAEALGIDDIEAADGTCVGCHFTLVGESLEDAEPIAGISCESCHGAAANWIEGHGEYPDDDAASESAEQKVARISAAQKAGQIRPAQINMIAANCLSCHTVPNEELVNTGGHTAGSEFELVAWSQGEVRHNLFWNDGESNAEATPARKRVLFVVGHATDLEFSLRALAKSTSAGKYREAMSARVKQATESLSSINAKISSGDVSSMLASAATVDLGAAPDKANIDAAADKIQAAIEAFTKANNGDALAALDPLLPSVEGRYSEKY